MFYIGSVLLSLAVVQFIMAAVLVTFWQLRMNAHGLREMAGAMTISSFGAVLTGVGAAKADFYAGFFGFQCFVIGVLLATRSMRRLQGLRPLFAMEAIALGVCIASNAYFLFIEHRLSGALAVNSLIYAIICGLTARHLLLETRSELKHGCRVLGSMFAAFALLSIVRAVLRFFIDIPTPTNVQVLSFDLLYTLVGIAISLGWSLGFLWTSYSVSESRLKAANEKLQRFSGAMAHDLNTPLNAIIGYLDAIDHLPEASVGKKAEFIKTAHEAALRMSNFIHRLLEQSPTEQAIQEQTTSDIMTCIKDAMIPLQSSLDSVDAEVNMDVAHIATTNAFQLTRVFQNILDNAIKYRSPDRRPRINISSRQTGGWIYISVQDNGLGISKADQGKVFQSFKRADNAKTIPGYGLGLSECWRILESLDGDIEVSSEPGVGTTFTLKFPVTRA